MGMIEEMIPNGRLVLPYVVPYVAYILIASFFHGYISTEVIYAIRIIVVAALILWARKWYFPLKGPNSPLISTAIGIGAGILGFIVWVLLMLPFAAYQVRQPWSEGVFILNLLSTGLIVPVFEEMLMRGFIFRLSLQWDQAKKINQGDPLMVALNELSINSVAPGDWSWFAVVVSTIAFTLGHHMQEWLAAFVFGLLMVWLWIIRKDVISCIVAHAVTNIILAIYVFTTGKWNLW